MSKDVEYLVDFVSMLDNAMILRENLDELQQAISLMQSENAEEEFYEASVRNRKYGRLDLQNGRLLLEKLIPLTTTPMQAARSAALNFGSRFGMKS